MASTPSIYDLIRVTGRPAFRRASMNGLTVMVVSMKVLVPWARFRYPSRCSPSGWLHAVTNRHRHRVPQDPSDATQASDPVVRV
jgi:hypothetical protein